MEDEWLVQDGNLLSTFQCHDYHQLVIIDGGEQCLFKLVKHGSFSVRPSIDGEDVEYLVRQLDQHVHRVYVYPRRINQALEVYDMCAA